MMRLFVRPRKSVRYISVFLVLGLVAAACGDNATSVAIDPVVDVPDDECLYRPDLLITEKTEAGKIVAAAQGNASADVGFGAAAAVVLVPDDNPPILGQPEVVVARRLDAEQLGNFMTVEDSNAATLEAITEVVDVWEVEDGDVLDSLQIAAALEKEGIDATPVLAFQLAGHWTFAPGAERVPVALNPNESDPETSSFTPGPVNGPQSNVAVIDTGGRAEDEGKGLRLLDEKLDVETLGNTDPYRWHGTFVASLIRTVDPNAVVTLVRLGPTSAPFFRGPEANEAIEIDNGRVQVASTDNRFASDELQFLHAVARLSTAQLDPAPVILNVSGGTYGCGDLGIGVGVGQDAQTVPVGEWAAGRLWFDDADDRHLVAAAGNDTHVADNEPDFYPAALAEVYGVASADAAGAISSFSNKGDICAGGEDLIGYTPAGIVSWSGTSFAAPIVSGLISKSAAVPVADDNKSGCVSADTVSTASVDELSYCSKEDGAGNNACTPVPK